MISERLTYLTEQLRELGTGRLGDPESNHVRADGLLIEVLREVWNQDVYATYQIEDVIVAYQAVGKWYA